MKYAVKDIFFLAIFLISLTAIFWLENFLYLFLNSFLMIFLVAFITRKRREVWPVLLIVGLLIIFESIIAYTVTEPMAFFLVFSLFDLFIAFSIVHYHRDKFFLSLCRVNQDTPNIPQVYLISCILALTSLYSFLLGTEMVFYTLDKQIFEGEEPYFYSIYVPVKISLKFLFDLSIWSLVLIPSNWRFLRKIEQQFHL